MVQGWEIALGERLQQVFGGGIELGLVALFVFGAITVAFRPPAIVSMAAIGTFILLIFGHNFGGLGISGSLAIGIAILLALLAYFAIKRPVRDF